MCLVVGDEIQQVLGPGEEFGIPGRPAAGSRVVHHGRRAVDCAVRAPQLTARDRPPGSAVVGREQKRSTYLGEDLGSAVPLQVDVGQQARRLLRLRPDPRQERAQAQRSEPYVQARGLRTGAAFLPQRRAVFWWRGHRHAWGASLQVYDHIVTRVNVGQCRRDGKIFSQRNAGLCCHGSRTRYRWAPAQNRRTTTAWPLIPESSMSATLLTTSTGT